MKSSLKLLLFNLRTDADADTQGFTTRWINALAKRVEKLYVITMYKGRLAVASNVAVYSVGRELGYSEARRLWRFYRLLFHALRQDRIDACFCHMIPIFTVLAAPVLKAKGIPIVTWFTHPSLTWKLKLAHRLSDRMATSVATSYPYKKDKLVVVGHGIDTDFFAADGTPPEEPPMILCVGRLSPVKDHPTLIRAAGILRKRLKRPVRVVILGGPPSGRDRPYVDALETLVEHLNLADVIRFVPPVPNAQLADWYRRCAVHVNLTPQGFADKVALEAMACERPSVVANEGFQDTLGHRAGQLLFRHGDAEDLASKIIELLEMSPKELQTIGQELRQSVVRLHSLDQLMERLVGIFQEVGAS